MQPGVVCTREQLLDSVWGHNRVVTGRTVDVCILRLRHKLEADPANPVRIRSARGFGYSLEEVATEEKGRCPDECGDYAAILPRGIRGRGNHPPGGRETGAE